ncbi:MAG: amino acid permease [Calditrichaeota bacterium]|nr:amino acid permease [Calditrichota bacterium]
MSQQPALVRKLSRFDLTIIVIGSVIGSGIFLTPSGIARQLPSPLLILMVWVLGGLLALSGALTFAELGARMPHAGGVYVFLTRAYGGLAGFLYGWAYFLVVNTGGLAALSIAFATYLGFFVPLSPLGIKLVAIGGLILLTAINYVGVKSGGIFADVFTLLKLIGIFGVILVGFVGGQANWDAFTTLWPEKEVPLGHALALAMVGVLWSYGGWQHATYVAGETRNERQNLPFALVTGTFIVVLVYVCTNLAYFFLLPLEAIAASERVAADAVATILGPLGGQLIAVAIFISVFGTAGIYTMTAPRIYYAMARDGVFFPKLAEIHPRFHVPTYAILFQTVWAIFLILSGTFYQLITYVAFTDWIFFALAGASVFIFRRRSHSQAEGFKTPGYPFTPLFFVIVSTWFVLNTLVSSPMQSLAGLGFLALGIPVYVYWKRRLKTGGGRNP